MARRKRDPYELNPAAGIAILLLGGAVLFLPGFGMLVAGLALFVAVTILAASSYRQARKKHRWQTISSFYTLSPEDFERHVADTFRHRGYATTLTPRVGDQGVDVIATRHDERIAIQCKRYSDKAANSAVQAVHAGRTHHGCNRSIVVCLGGFSQSAHALARSTNVELIDGDDYAMMVHEMSQEAARRFAAPEPQSALYAAALTGIAVVSFLLGHLVQTKLH